jgi:hypothetical protein
MKLVKYPDNEIEASVIHTGLNKYEVINPCGVTGMSD